MDFEKFSQKTKQQINQELNKLLKSWRSEVGKINKNLLLLADQFIEGCQGGKRLRGVLVVLGYELGLSFWGVRHWRTTPESDSGCARRLAYQNDIFKVAAAYEIFHTAILAHDDVMDQSTLRRGKPSLYVALGSNHLGISQAINLGDAGFFLALKIISGSNFPDPVKIEVLKWFCQVMLDTAAGQMLDLAKQDPITTAKLKTAKYSMIGPLVLGAILGGANQTLLKYLGKFGGSLGIAFQIRDDILDSEVEIWGGASLAKQTAEKYQKQAMKIIPEITKDKNMGKLLEQLAEYLVERKK